MSELEPVKGRLKAIKVAQIQRELEGLTAKLDTILEVRSSTYAQDRQKATRIAQVRREIDVLEDKLARTRGLYPNSQSHPGWVSTIITHGFHNVLLKEMETHEMLLREILTTLKDIRNSQTIPFIKRSTEGGEITK